MYKKKSNTKKHVAGVGGGNVHYIYINIYNIYFVMQYTVCIYMCVCVCVNLYTHMQTVSGREL